MRLQSPQLRACGWKQMYRLPAVGLDLKVISVSPYKEVTRGGRGEFPMCRHVYSTQLCVNICRNKYICVSVGVKAPS